MPALQRKTAAPRQPLRKRQNGLSASSTGRRSSVAYWLLLFLLSITIVYFGAVLLVAKNHLGTKSKPHYHSNIPPKNDHIRRPPVKEVKPDTHAHEDPEEQYHEDLHQKPPDDHHNDSPKVDEKVSETKKSEHDKDSSKNKPNPVRKHHLENEFGHGVDPQTLLNHEGEFPIAYKEDTPKDTHPDPEHILTAYIEKTDFDEWEVRPLPKRRLAEKSKLNKVEYTRLKQCSKFIQQFPVDDTPTEHDPFLPWIHDVFPTADGKYIQIVAQNKRRCKTGKKEQDIMMHMQPQAALFQHIPIKRIKEESSTKYRLSTHEDADPDGIATRFICRFKPSMEETLSVFNFDYDWTSYRKRMLNGFMKDDGGIKSIHTTQLIFRCPVPVELQETVRKGTSVKDDFATLFLDVIPIRTPPRYGPPNQFLQPQHKEFELDGEKKFDLVKQYGDNYILPAIEDSGRWENIPICLPSLMQFEGQEESNVPAVAAPTQKKHKLATCIWASAGYTTRGNRFAINDGQRRLLEWISYNKIIGFDHFYLYDNSGAFTNDTSLKPIADLFPGEVTYIPWPSQICNNNPNNVDSPGERSSQYAAESSCRLRFGPHVDWFGQFDIDEYFVPMGKHRTATELLDELDKEDTRIVAFGSWRAWPRKAYVNEIEPIDDPDICWSKETCFHLTIPENVTMLQAYNCDRQRPGQKTKTMPAEKQFFKADYVLQHFIHYSAATVLSELNRTEWKKQGFDWRLRGFPDPRQRFGDELHEGLMIHSKAVAVQDTAGYKKVCNVDNLKLEEKKRGLCRLGIPFPETNNDGSVGTPDGWAYNCYVNEKAENYFVPKLNEALSKFGNVFGSSK